MSFFSGTATNWLDFLAQLETKLTGAGHAWGKGYAGTGNGTITGPAGEDGGYTGGASSVAETFTLTATNATTFSVVGSASGNLGNATVGTAFNHAKISFRINAGGTAFIAGDVFTLAVTPAWSLQRKHGVVGASKRTGNLVNLANLYDGSVTTWATLVSGSLPAYAAIEMLAAAEVKAITLGVGDTLNRGARDFALEYSDNGSSWTQAQAWTGVTWQTTRQRQTFAVTGTPGAHVYWRLAVSAIQAGGTQLENNELDFLTDLSADYGLETRAQIVFRAPGNDGTKQIYIGAELYEDTAAGAYTLNWYGFRSFAVLSTIRTQINNSGLRAMPLANSALGWWMAVNGQRAVLVVKIGSVYVSAYLGFGLPYETPDIHPFPMVVGAASSTETELPTSTSPNFRGFFDPGRYGLSALYPDNVWRVHANRFDQGNDDGDTITAGKVYPAAMATNGARGYLRENIDGSYPLVPVTLVHTGVVRHAWGELDGCWATSGFGLSSEATITRNGFTHRVFQSTFRTDVASFMALRQD